jgi:peptidyl-prolyl cis-trans isomerase SurA
MKKPSSCGLVGVVAFLALGAAPSSADVLERVIAKVNGEIITLSELRSRQLAAVREAGVPMERVEAYLREHNREIVQEMTDELVLAQKAVEEYGPISEDRQKLMLDGLKQDMGIASDEELVSQLRQEGLTLDDLKRNMARSILMRRYVSQEVEKKVTVSEAELRAEYELRRATEYTVPPTEELQEIVFETKDANNLEQARAILARARAGEDFAALARSYSTGATRANGGNLGRIARPDISADLKSAVEKLQVGEVSEPIRTRSGYRLIKVLDRSDAKVKSYDEISQGLNERMQRERRNVATNKLIEKLRKEAVIQDMVREVPLQVNPAELAGTSIIDAAQQQVGQGAADSDAEFVSRPGKVERTAPPSAAGTPEERPSPQNP